MTNFSIVIATRNRPQLFAQALGSVLAQTCPATEVVVVNDGSDDRYIADYREILREAAGCVRFFSLVQRPRGHGHAYALNFGVSQTSGSYVGFLDDDDEWSDVEYLDRVRSVIEGDDATVDLHLSDQAAFVAGERKPGPIWIEDLAELLKNEGVAPERHGAYRVTVEQLLRCHGFAHLNTSIVRRSLFDQIGGLDEGNRYEHDRDFFLRLIDQAQAIRYTPRVVSHHRVPDPRQSANVSTSFSRLAKYAFQLQLLNKAHCFSMHPELRAYSRTHMVYTLKKVAEDLVSQKRYREALFYARLALAGAPNAKWAGYTFLIMLRALSRR